jgi:transposase
VGNGVIQVTPQMRILVAIEAVDGRKGIASLARLCQEKLQADPFSGCVFVFQSRRGTSIRILVYDGQGFWLAQKRLSKGRVLSASLRSRGDRLNLWEFWRGDACV